VCFANVCAKLFDIKIIDFESPVRLGEFFDFTYFVKGVADINSDVEISFWIERKGEIITSGSDTIYLGNFEEKTETTKLFLPSSFESGIYEFYIRVSHPSYSAESHRTIEVQVKGGIVSIDALDLGSVKTYVMVGLVLIAIILLSAMFYMERKKVLRGIIIETRWIKKHRTFVLASSLAVVLILIIFLSNLIDILSRAVLEVGSWLIGLLSYIYYILGVILILFIGFKTLSYLKRKDFLNKFREKRRKKKALERLILP